MGANRIYADIFDEVSQKQFEPVSWERALSENPGDESKARAAYIKYRYQSLGSACGILPDTPAQRADDVRLCEMIRISEKPTLYSYLGLLANAAQDRVIAACIDREQQAAQGDMPEEQRTMLRHAIGVLSDPVTRRAYNANMLRQLESGKVVSTLRSDHKVHAIDADEKTGLAGWLEARKFGVAISLLAALSGAWILAGYLAEKDRVKVALEQEQTKRQAIESGAVNEAGHVQNERVWVDGTVGNQRTAIVTTASVADRALDMARQEQERRWVIQEAQAKSNAERMQIQQQRMEEQRRQSEEARQVADAQRRVDKDRQTLFNQLLSEGRFAEAREWAKTPYEISMVNSQQARQQAQEQMKADNERQIAMNEALRLRRFGEARALAKNAQEIFMINNAEQSTVLYGH